MEWLSEERNPKFSRFRIDDTNRLSGARKNRTVFNPNADARRMNRSLIAYLSRITPPLPCATACRSGDSALGNIERHRGNIHFFVTDLRNAYGSVDCRCLARMLCGLDASLPNETAVANALFRICCIPDEGLVPGAPGAPLIFNLYAGTLLDGELAKFCAVRDITYSRYLDDLTFSSPHPIGKRKRKVIRSIVERAGFTIAHGKSHVFDLRKGAIQINGIGISSDWRIFVPRKFLDRIKGLLHQYRRRNITRERAAGAFGVFLNLTRGEMNRTEQRVFSKARLLKVASDRRPKLKGTVAPWMWKYLNQRSRDGYLF